MRCLIPAKAMHAAEAKVGAKARSGRQGPQVACSAEGRDTARVTRNDSETAGRLDSGGRKASHSERLPAARRSQGTILLAHQKL